MVLVVDDEPLVVELISRTLRDLGLRVQTAADGHEVIDRVDVKDFDIIILDFKMPEVGGAQLFEQIESMAENVAPRVLFITGDIHSGQASEIVRRTGNPVLRKPFVLEDLIAAVVGVAERRKNLEGG
jgi:CheY-like chemotaxis protein